MEWFYEVLTVIAFSRRIQGTIFMGMLGFIAMNLRGYFLLSDFEIQGAMAPFAEIVKDVVVQRYDKAAFAILFGGVNNIV